MTVVSMKALLESGVHFGHRTHKWHPAMKPYIFTERNGIHIIDLQKTAKALEHAYNLIRDNVGEGGTLLFVGTKRQAQDTIRDEAIRCGMPYVTNRWLGGMLTNWRTIRQRVLELDRLERMRERGDFARLTKKEALILERKMERLEVLFGGIRKLPNLPDMMFLIDVHREATAVHEANLLNIPIVALVDTNCDPTPIDHVIPSNDDAIRAIKLLVGKVADAVLEGKAQRKEEEIETLPTEGLMAIAEEPELTDEELLGEATLAKLPMRGKPLLEELEEEILVAEGVELEEIEDEEEELEDIEIEEVELEEIEEESEREIEEEEDVELEEIEEESEREIEEEEEVELEEIEVESESEIEEEEEE